MPGDPESNPDSMLTGFYIIFVILSVILGAAYSFCSSYLHHVSENRLKRESENRSARLLLALLAQNGEVTCRISVFFWGLVGCTSLSTLLIPRFTALLPFVSPWKEILGILLGLLLSAFFILLFADVIPRKLTAHRALRYTYKRAPLIRFFFFLGKPLYAFIRWLSDLVIRLFGLDPHSINDSVTEEEIMLTLDRGEEKGVIEETEKDMIENILDFNDTLVSEIMTHRTDLCAAEDTLSIEEALHLAVEAGRSRVPVYHEDIDSICGILYVKDLLPYIGKSIPEFITLTDIVRPAYFIPETKKCSQLFSELTEKKIHIAVIVDEYGGTCGLVTIEDLIESIVGNIQDEYDNEEEEILRLSETEFTVDGSTSIDEISDLTDTDLPEGDYDTIAGFVTERLGRILKEDDRPVLTEKGLEISVLEVEDQRISKLKIRKLPPPPQEEKNGKQPKNGSLKDDKEPIEKAQAHAI